MRVKAEPPTCHSKPFTPNPISQFANLSRSFKPVSECPNASEYGKEVFAAETEVYFGRRNPGMSVSGLNIATTTELTCGHVDS